MPDNLSRSFGLTIAFLIPGLVGLYAVSYSAPVVRDWFGIAADKPTSVGGFLFVAVASSGMGVFISGLRWLVLERLLKFVDPPPANIDYARRKDEKCEAPYQDLILRHYQFYQFYANMPFALAFVYLAWLAAGQGSWERAGWLAFIMILADGVLLMCAKNAIQRYDEKVIDLLGLKKMAA